MKYVDLRKTLCVLIYILRMFFRWSSKISLASKTLFNVSDTLITSPANILANTITLATASGPQYHQIMLIQESKQI